MAINKFQGEWKQIREELEKFQNKWKQFRGIQRASTDATENMGMLSPVDTESLRLTVL